MFDFECYSGNIAVITDQGEQLTYGQLASEVEKLYAAIPSKGFMFTLCENSLGSFVGYVAGIFNHIPQVLLDGKKDFELVQRLIGIYQPEYLWMPSARVDEFKEEQKGATAIYEFCGNSLLQMQYATQEQKDINPELLLCLTTSGSTGSPKLVKLTEQNLLSNAESIAEYLNITADERPITSLPMYYSYGLSVINSHLIKGATILLTDYAVIQKEFWNFAKEQHATSIAGVPYTYEMLRRLRIFRMDLPDLKTMTQAGGKLNAKIAEEYIRNAEETGRKFFVMYGQTEATARMSYLPQEHALEKYAGIGIAIPGGSFSLIDANGNEITEPDVDGELVYKGTNVSMGYAECIADLGKGDENHGELHTGDVARRDADGYYYITGRMKRFVKVWGNRCNLDATEQLVKSITTNCACAGVDDKITIFVTEEGLDASIKSLLSEKMGLNTRAFAVKVIAEIPKNASGKVQYAELQKLLD